MYENPLPIEIDCATSQLVVQLKKGLVSVLYCGIFLVFELYLRTVLLFNMTTSKKRRNIELFSQEFRDLLASTSFGNQAVCPCLPDGVIGQELVDERELPSTAGEPWKKKDPSCLSCHVVFGGREEQVEHYQLDWHRYNLKRSLKGLSSVDLDQFERMAGEEASGRGGGRQA